METKANHLLIGSFVLLLAAGIFAGIIWLARIDINERLSYYVIHFTDSVAGLRIGGDVRFNGIQVGTVKTIQFDDTDPRRVKVTVEIAASTPVRHDSYAEMEPQGITGVSYILITGGTAASKLLKYHHGKPPPEIPARPSQISQLIDAAPEVLSRAVAALDNINKILGPENQARIAKILNDTSQVTDTIAGRKHDLDAFISSARAAADDVAASAKAIHTITEKLDHVADETSSTMKDAQASLGNFNSFVLESRRTAQDLGKTADLLNNLVSSNSDAIHEFANDGLPQMVRLIAEARQLVASLTRVSDRIENDPTQFLFGDKAPERKAQ
ncbi:MAG TPA: MlaD family protein [Candidatus Sulfotelmatobacter sp.]|nr:MlaD family protein [Candidatus Sulfotelmatobacter sp.]